MLQTILNTTLEKPFIIQMLQQCPIFSSFQNVDLSFEISFDSLFKVLDETENRPLKTTKRGRIKAASNKSLK